MVCCQSTLATYVSYEGFDSGILNVLNSQNTYGRILKVPVIERAP